MVWALLVHRFIPKAKFIGQGFAAFFIIIAVQFFEMGIGNLCRIFTHLDFGDNFTSVVLYRHQLIHPAEYRGTFGGN